MCLYLSKLNIKSGHQTLLCSVYHNIAENTMLEFSSVKLSHHHLIWAYIWFSNLPFPPSNVFVFMPLLFLKKIKTTVSVITSMELG